MTRVCTAHKPHASVSRMCGRYAVAHSTYVALYVANVDASLRIARRGRACVEHVDNTRGERAVWGTPTKDSDARISKQPIRYLANGCSAFIQDA